MVTSVQLGNFYTTPDGKTVLGSAGGSGLDTKSIITALVDAKKLSVTRIQDKIAVNDKKLTALSTFNSLTSAFKDAADLLRNVPGFSKASSNAFDYATASVASNTAVAGSSYIAVTVDPGTRAQSYTINKIESLAQAKKQATDNPFVVANADTSVTKAVAAANEFQAGTVTINGVDITLDEGDSLNRIASKFNAVSNDTGIIATVLKISDGNYKMTFSATATGEDADFDLMDAGTVTDPDGVLSQLSISETQPASNAKFTVDGVEIERQSNSINDVVSGVTFNLLQSTPALTELTLSIKPDTTVAKNAIIGFINAYNDIKIFASKQSQLDPDGTFADDSVLASNTTLRSTVDAISSELSRVVGGLGTDALRRLSDVGITFTDLQATDKDPFTRNVLTLDESKLDAALSSKFEEVAKIFEFNFTSNNPNLTVFTRTNSLAVTSMTLNLNPATQTYEATYTDSDGPHTIQLDAVAFASGGGYTLTGKAGTVLEGLKLLYGSEDAATMNVSMSQGVADRIFNSMDTLLKSQTGSLAVEIDAVKTNSEKLQTDIDRQNELIERFRQQMLARFQALESAISRVNTLLQALDADSQARSNS